MKENEKSEDKSLKRKCHADSGQNLSRKVSHTVEGSER